MGFFVKRTGFIDIDVMARSIIGDMMSAGFTLLYPSTLSPSVKSYTLQAGSSVDPLNTTQPWAIKFIWDLNVGGSKAKATNFLDVIVATPKQFTASDHAKYQRYFGRTSTLPSTSSGVSVDVIGLIGSACGREQTDADAQQGFATRGFRDRTFIDRSAYKEAGELQAYPMSYVLSVSNRGVVLYTWEEGHDRDANRFSWFAVQRPVDNVNGQVIVDGKAPVHCMYGLVATAKDFPNNDQAAWRENSIYQIRRFIVREADIHVPYPVGPISGETWPSLFTLDKLNMGVSATQHSVDYNMVINAEQQVAITENNKYVITFPNGLNTSRYAYTHEMDMIAYTSADVVSEGTEVPVQVYGESAPRKYIAMTANSPNNTGMRLLILSDGGGVAAAP